MRLILIASLCAAFILCAISLVEARDKSLSCIAPTSEWEGKVVSLNVSDQKEFLQRVPHECPALAAMVRRAIGQNAAVVAKPIQKLPNPVETTPLRGRKRPTNAIKSGVVIRDCPDCPEVVVVPSGAFVMGSSSSNPYRHEDEGPQVQVKIRSFAIGKYEVTFDQWKACVADGGCDAYMPDDAGWGRGSRPVIYISWKLANSYVSWLSKKTGHVYRLPSESEWEYVARAGTGTQFGYGDDISLICGYGNVADQSAPWGSGVSCNDGYTYTAPVGQFRPNAFGVYDMIGNVSEWVADCYHASLAGEDSEGKPYLDSNCTTHVAKGSAWGLWNYAEPANAEVRLSARFGSGDNEPLGGDSGDGDGFRVARELTP